MAMPRCPNVGGLFQDDKRSSGPLQAGAHCEPGRPCADNYSFHRFLPSRHANVVCQHHHKHGATTIQRG